MTENPMVLGAQREQREQEARAQRESHAHATSLDSFLAALEVGPNARIAHGDKNEQLHEVVASLLADDDAIVGLVLAIRASRDVGLWLAARYADRELATYVDEGSL